MKQYNLFGGIDILSFELKKIKNPYLKSIFLSTENQ